MSITPSVGVPSLGAPTRIGPAWHDAKQVRWLPASLLGRIVVLGFAAYFVMIVVVPIGGLAWQSLERSSFVKREFIGLENYAQMVSDPVVYQSVVVTLGYMLLTVPVQVSLGFLVASMVHFGVRSRRARVFLVGYFYLPAVIPIAAIATIWKAILGSTQTGLINSVVVAFGGSPVQWLTNPNTALLSLAITSWLTGIGLATVLFVAGLTAIPSELEEAASVDGAGPVRRLRHITFPLMLPTVTLVSIILFAYAAQMFVPVLVMTGGDVGTLAPKGGPLFATHTYTWNLYNEGFLRFNEGYAAALSLAYLVALGIVGILQMRLGQRHSYET